MSQAAMLNQLLRDAGPLSDATLEPEVRKAMKTADIQPEARVRWVFQVVRGPDNLIAEVIAERIVEAPQ